MNTQEIKKQAREEWENSELSKRITATELFAINHGFEQWEGKTISDFLDSLIDKTVQMSEERIVNVIKNKEKFTQKPMKCHCNGAIEGRMCVAYEDAYCDAEQNIISLITNKSNK